MEIRSAKPDDRAEIVALYKKVQAATGIPDPRYVPPDTLEGRIYQERSLNQYVAVVEDRISGHGMIELADPGHLDTWLAGLPISHHGRLLELGGAFVDPEQSGRAFGASCWHIG